MNHLAFINNRIGYVYSFPIRLGGYLLAAIGVAILLTSGWGLVLGVVLIIAGFYFSFTHTGILVDAGSKSVRHYTSMFGLRQGSWKEYPTHNHICVIRKDRKRKRFYEESTEQGDSPYQFEVYLVSRSFRGKVLLEICEDRENAEFRASRYATDMTAQVVEYEAPNRAKSSSKKGSSERSSHGGYHKPKSRRNDFEE